MSEHTPGPWEACNGAVYTTGPSPRLICTTNYNGLPGHEDMANAFVLAAGPAMLAALKAGRPALIEAGALVALASVDLAIAAAEGRANG